MSKKATRHVTFTNADKKKLIAELGFKVFTYSGKMNDAPRQWKHLYRDLKQGFSLVQDGTEKPLRHLEVGNEGRFEEVQRRVTDMAFVAVLAREVSYKLGGIYAVVERDGSVNTHDFRSLEDGGVTAEYMTEVAEYISTLRVRPGVYFYKDDATMLGPYRDLQILLFDAIMEEDYSDLYAYGTVTYAKPTTLPQMHDRVKSARTASGITVQRTGNFEFVLRNGVV